MADTVSPEVRSRMMSAVKSKNTKPELQVRTVLHALGFRFRLHRSDLPGKPDLVFPRYHAVVFIHGCFWHGHDCILFRWPKTRREFWRSKIESNVRRDHEHMRALVHDGWRVATIWECALRGRTRLSIDSVGEKCGFWLMSNDKSMELVGDATRSTM